MIMITTIGVLNARPSSASHMTSGTQHPALIDGEEATSVRVEVQLKEAIRRR